jgi:hypothetical protein
MLDNSRAFPFAAADLFNGVSRQVVGRSLQEDDRDLWRGVEDLFRARNKIAHRADLLDNSTALRHIRAAMAATEWLGSLADTRRTEPAGRTET